MLQPAKGYVLLKEKKTEGKSVIILDEKAQKKFSEWIIERVGDGSQFKKGQSVIFDNKAVERGDVSSVMEDGKEFWISTESAIIATK